MDPLSLTYERLATSENEAATSVLVAVLEHRQRSVADRAAQAILQRQAPAALEQLIRRWHVHGDRWKSFVVQRPGVLTASFRAAFTSDDETLWHNTAAAVVAVADYELCSTLVHACCDASPLKRRLASTALLQLAELLYEELHRETCAAVARRLPRHDPQCVREFFVGSLEPIVATYPQHQSRELLEAYLLLAPRECATLRHLLQDSREPAHEPLCDQLLHSTRPGIIRLLLSFLEDPHAPLAVLRVLSRRSDVGFVRHLAARLVEPHSPQVERNLARIDRFAWVDDELAMLTALGAAEQPGIARLVMHSKLPLAEKQRVLTQLLDCGAPIGRQAGAQALFLAYDGECDWLVEELIHDPCPLVQAEAARHLRACDLPDSVQTLIELLESPHQVVQNAARESLAEFRFSHYLAGFDRLSESARQSTGELMLRVDLQAKEELAEELLAPGKTRRMRALQIVALLDLAAPLEAMLVEVSRDEHSTIRQEAARLLGNCSGNMARQALRELMNDSSASVQLEAERALWHAAAHALEVAP